MEETIIRHLRAETSSEEERQLSAWRRESSENERRCRQIRELWLLTGSANPMNHRCSLPDPDWLIARSESVGLVARPRLMSVDDGFAGREGFIPQPSAQGQRGLRSWRHNLPMKIVAALAFMVPMTLALSLLLGDALSNSGEPAGVLTNGELTTGPGEMTMVILADGTNIRLGPSSRLRLSETGQARGAWLEGRAFFGVQADPSRPFTVTTSNGEAVVLGTRFEVRAEEDEFRVLVVEGRVEMAAGKARAELTEGEMSRSIGGSGPMTVRVHDIYEHLDWMGNVLVFQSTPLARAFLEVGHWYGVDVVFDDESLADLPITATFTGQEARDVALVLCEIVRARCAIDEDLIQVHGRADVLSEFGKNPI